MTSTVTVTELRVSPNRTGTSGSTSAGFHYTCSVSAPPPTGSVQGTVDNTLVGYSIGLALVQGASGQGIKLSYEGGPNYKYFDVCQGYTSSPDNLAKNVLNALFSSGGQFQSYVFNLSGETASFSGRLPYINDHSYREYSGTLELNLVRTE